MRTGGRSSAFLRRHVDGTLIGRGAYMPDTASVALAERRFDLAAFGRLFLANADLVAKVRSAAALTPYSRQVFEALR